MSLIDLSERGLVPDALLRHGIRRLCEQRLRDEHADDAAAADARFRALLDELRRSPIAIETDAANEQHYEVPTRFFELCLGKRFKYSSCYYATGRETLDEAEEAMLALYGERAQLADGQRILELGCGWGSLTLWMAERFPTARITGVSNSRTQREHILGQAAARGLGNVEIITTDVNRLALPEGAFDRVVSIEMYEAVGEEYWPGYFATIHKALKPGGRAAIQGITISPKIFDDYRRKRDFIQKYIFPGGMLCPPGRFQDLAFEAELVAEDAKFYATDYADTLAHWHRNVLAVRDQIVQQFDERFLRMWRYYLSYCECGFRTGSIDLMQITLRKAG